MEGELTKEHLVGAVADVERALPPDRAARGRVGKFNLKMRL